MVHAAHGPAQRERCDVCGVALPIQHDPLWLCYRYVCPEHGQRFLVTYLAIANEDSALPPSELSLQARRTARDQLAYRARVYLENGRRLADQLPEPRTVKTDPALYWLALPGE